MGRGDGVVDGGAVGVRLDWAGGVAEVVELGDDIVGGVGAGRSAAAVQPRSEADIEAPRMAARLIRRPYVGQKIGCPSVLPHVGTPPGVVIKTLFLRDRLTTCFVPFSSS
jgi:hypothetical protein